MHGEPPEKFMEFFNYVPQMPSYDIEVWFRQVGVTIPEEVMKAWVALPREEFNRRTQQVRQAEQFICSIRAEGMELDGDEMNHLSENYPDVAAFVTDKVYRTSKEWCTPFHYEANGKMSVRVDYLYYSEDGGGGSALSSRNSITFTIGSDEISEVKRDGTSITVVAKNGDRIVARPAAKFSRTSWYPGRHGGGGSEEPSPV